MHNRSVVLVNFHDRLALDFTGFGFQYFGFSEPRLVDFNILSEYLRELKSRDSPAEHRRRRFGYLVSVACFDGVVSEIYRGVIKLIDGTETYRDKKRIDLESLCLFKKRVEGIIHFGDCNPFNFAVTFGREYRMFKINRNAHSLDFIGVYFVTRNVVKYVRYSDDCNSRLKRVICRYQTDVAAADYENPVG